MTSNERLREGEGEFRMVSSSPGAICNNRPIHQETPPTSAFHLSSRIPTGVVLDFDSQAALNHPQEKRSLENLAANLIRSSLSQQRMKCLTDQAKVAYRSKDGRKKKTYDALEWLAAMGSHVPERGRQSVR